MFANLAAIETGNNGKPLREAYYDVADAANCFRYYAGLVTKPTGQTYDVPDAMQAMTVREPIGVCGQIVPWNYPLLMGAWKLAPALAAGKCVVQCKARARPVGEPVLRDLFGTMHAQGANKGILITTSSFTAAALRFAQGKPLELIDGDLYRDLCEQHGLIAYGTSVESLPDVLFDPNSTKVRIKSIDCTDPAARKSMQDYVFAVGQLSIGNCLRVHEPGTDRFGQCPMAERLAFFADAGPTFELRIHKMEEVGTTYDLNDNATGEVDYAIAWSVTEVPEPGTLLLTFVGGIALLRRRRNLPAQP